MSEDEAQDRTNTSGDEAGTGDEDASSKDFAAQSTQARTSLVGEFVDFLKHNKKWWLAPIIITILFLGLVVMMGGTAAAPFIYTLF
ncbi:MAG: hypothetical protein HN712_08655 [Gemmatimonadetes bacterium]|jgi:hypothetical protein|nr:hypothetical protein [Gemmatimonadota bacterium]MBT6147601.1 hypothetical protein [Gemmatimonadota bacterium]MBT7860370.1 hypothetical protein [Gemmatimonadota bacterium]